jgi:hypothetical protein
LLLKLAKPGPSRCKRLFCKKERFASCKTLGVFYNVSEHYLNGVRLRVNSKNPHHRSKNAPKYCLWLIVMMMPLLLVGVVIMPRMETAAQQLSNCMQGIPLGGTTTLLR